MPGNPYNGHTLVDALEQVETLTDRRPSLAVVDRGYANELVASLLQYVERSEAISARPLNRAAMRAA